MSFFAEVGIEVAITIGVTKNRNYYKATILKGEMKVDSQKSKVQGKLRKGVFFPAAGALVIFIGLVAAFPDKAYEVLTGLLYKMGGSCGWAIELLIFFVFVGGLILACTKYGNIRIGGDNAKPHYSMWSWITMSICGAIGTGIIFWALGEPIYQYMGPASSAGVEPGSEAAATWAVSQTMFHWSLRTVRILFRTCYRFRAASL